MLCVKLVFRFVFILFFRTYVWNISVACSVTYITDVVHRPIVWCSLTVHFLCHTHRHTHTRTHTRTRAFNGPFFRDYPGEPVPERWKPIWILLKQEIGSGSGISWAMCKSAPRSRQITIPAPTTQFFYRPDALPAAQPTVSKRWRQTFLCHIPWKSQDVSFLTFITTFNVGSDYVETESLLYWLYSL